MIIKNKKIKLINLITGTSFLTFPLISISADGSPQNSKIRLDLSGITKNSFEIIGSIGKAKIIFKKGLSIPKQVKFYKIIIAQNNEIKESIKIEDDNVFLEQNNNFYNLSNNQEVSIRFQIRKEYREKYTFFWNNKELSYKDIKWKVSGLKMAVKTNYLTASSFETLGASGSATITKRDEISFPSQVQITYAKEKTNGEEPLSPRDYSDSAPTTLSYGDKVYINFAIKSDATSTHKLPDGFRNNPVVFTVSRPKIEINTSNLAFSSFELKGHNGSGILAIRNGISLPSQVEVEYAASHRSEPKNKDYSSTPLSKLSNGDIVYIKFDVKSKYALTHKLPKNFKKSLSFYTNGLKTGINTSNLVSSSFELTGHNGSGTLAIKSDISLPEQVEVEYAISDGDEPQNTVHSWTPPSTLLNGNRVYIKFLVRSKYLKTHKLPEDFTNTIVFPVKELPKKDIEVSKLKASSFEVSGSNGAGSLSINADLPSQVDVEYATSHSLVQDLNSLSFSSTISPTTSLSNGDIVYIKFSITSEAASTHKFPSSFSKVIIFTVDQKTEINTSNLVLSSFETNGHNGSGTLAIKSGSPLPPQVDVAYAVLPSPDGDPTSLIYSSTMPESLSNDDKVYIKFSITSEAASTHKFPLAFKNLVVFTVFGLKTEINTSNLVSSSFETNGNNGSGTLAIKSGSPLPPQVDVAYAVLPSPDGDPTSLIYSSTMPESLSNDDKVYIKFSITSEAASTHKFPLAFKNLVVFTVSGLKTEINTSNLVSSSFETNGNNGSGTLAIKSGSPLPPQVDVAYAVLPSPDGDPTSLIYSSTMPESLSNDDKVYIKFEIKRGDASTHKLPDGFTNNPVIFTVSGLKTEVKTTDLTAGSFEASGTHGSGTITIKTSAKIPEQLEITYAKESENKAPSPEDYSETAPRTLSNDDKVYIKFAIKEDHEETHQFPLDFANPIIITATSLNQIESSKESPKSEISESETKTSSNKVKKQAKKTKLSKGAIAGIVIGSILGVGAIGGFVAVKFLKIDIKKLMGKMKPKNKK